MPTTAPCPKEASQFNRRFRLSGGKSAHVAGWLPPMQQACTAPVTTYLDCLDHIGDSHMTAIPQEAFNTHLLNALLNLLTQKGVITEQEKRQLNEEVIAMFTKD